MAKGVIYIMTSAVPGLIKIGSTKDFEKRMYELEHNGYRNVTALKRAFAIEVEDYQEKETLLHTIFEKSRLADSELFAIDCNLVIQLLTSFDGAMIYPTDETKSEVFSETADNSMSRYIPNGEYYFKRLKKSDNKTVVATAVVQNGYWTIKKDSILGLNENPGVSKSAKRLRMEMPLDKNGRLLEDFNLGECSPSFASSIVLYAATDGWTDWKNADGKPVAIYKIVGEDE